MADVDIDKALELAKRIERDGWDEIKLCSIDELKDLCRTLIACREPVEVLHKPVSARRSKCVCGYPLIGPEVEKFCPGCGHPINWREA